MACPVEGGARRAEVAGAFGSKRDGIIFTGYICTGSGSWGAGVGVRGGRKSWILVERKEIIMGGRGFGGYGVRGEGGRVRGGRWKREIFSAVLYLDMSLARDTDGGSYFES